MKTNKFLLWTSIVFLTACGDMKDKLGIDQGDTPPPPPLEGTVLSESCEGTTKIVETADGNGGSTTQSTLKSEECGYVPPLGELLDQQCDASVVGVEIFTYADGEGGEYTEENSKSYECGYEDPVVEVTVGEAGDRFKPVVIDVQTTQYGEPIDAEWDYETTDSTIGVVNREDSQLHILGDSRVGEGVVLINGDEYQYSIVEEPTCTTDAPESGFGGVPTDCEGHWQSGGGRAGFIWYGEEDEQIVEVEFIHWHYFRQYEIGQEVRGEIIYPVGFESGLGEDGLYRINISNSQRAISKKPGDKVYETGLRYQEKANEQFEKAGIHIRLKMVAAFESNYAAVGARFRGWMDRGYMPGADVVGQTGISQPGTCGVAFASTFFGPQYQPRTFMTRCGVNVWLHELGHNVGMAHGPFNSSNESRGYIWPDFGHGVMSFCGIYLSSIMSYGRNREMFSNSKMTCGDYGVPEKYADPESFPVERGPSSTVPTSSDEAYHMNRIRYNLSLIWDEAEEAIPEELRPQLYIDDQWEGEPIVD